jgi:hypothetical protein
MFSRGKTKLQNVEAQDEAASPKPGDEAAAGEDMARISSGLFSPMHLLPDRPPLPKILRQK